MPRPYRPAEMMRVLESFGWSVVRETQTHVKMKKEGVRELLSIPTSTREVAIGTFLRELRLAEIKPRQFEERAREIL